MKIDVVGIEAIEVYANMVRIKHENRGCVDSSKATDILLGKICQQLEVLIINLQLKETLNHER